MFSTVEIKKHYEEGGYFMNKRSLKSLVFSIVCVLLAGAFLIGCNSKQVDKPSANTPTPTPPVETPSTPEPKSDKSVNTVKLVLYYPNAEATGLIAANRTVEVTNQEIIKAIFNELAVPPSGLEKPLPQGTTLLGATVSADGLATIDLSQEFQTNFNGGSAGEQMTLYSIVNSLTALPNVDSVQFLIAGAVHDGILGHIDTSGPVTPNEDLILKVN